MRVDFINFMHSVNDQQPISTKLSQITEVIKLSFPTNSIYELFSTQLDIQATYGIITEISQLNHLLTKQLFECIACSLELKLNLVTMKYEMQREAIDVGCGYFINSNCPECQAVMKEDLIGREFEGYLAD